MKNFSPVFLLVALTAITLGACDKKEQALAPTPEPVLESTPEVKAPEVEAPEVKAPAAEAPVEKPVRAQAQPKPAKEPAKPKAELNSAAKPAPEAPKQPQVAKAVKTGSICGKVTRKSGAEPMANVTVVAREYNGWVIHASDKTSADGRYCLNVPVGRYNIGAINSADPELDPDKSASAWWSKTGNGREIREGSIVRFSKTPVTGVNFDLAPGARIQGKLATFDKGSAEGVEIVVRDFDSRGFVTSIKVGAGNNFAVNVPAGDYLLIASNQTLNAPYASQIYGAAGKYNNGINAGSRVKLYKSDTRQADMALARGYRLSGTVRDASGGKYVPGVRVRVNIPRSLDFGGPAARIRTDGDGAFRIWLKPDSYTVDSRGNEAVDVNLSSSNKTINFRSPRAIVKGVIKDGNGRPADTVKVVMFEDPDGGNTYELASQEISTSDGAFTLYGAPGSAYKVLFRVDEKRPFGSIVHASADTINGGTTVRTNSNASLVTDIGTTILPTVNKKGGMGWITGTVGPNDNTGIKGGQLVRVRPASGGRDKRFFVTRTKGDGSFVLPVPTGGYRVFIVKNKHENVWVRNDTTTKLNLN